MNRFFKVLLLLSMVSLTAQAQTQNSGDSLDAIQSELDVLQKQIGQYESHTVELSAKQDYVNQLLDLRARLLALEIADADQGSAEQQGASGEHVLYLLKIEGPPNTSDPMEQGQRTRQFESSKAGVYINADSVRGQGQFSYRFSDYPQTIELGQPFKFAGDLRMQGSHAAAECLGSGLYPSPVKSLTKGISAAMSFHLSGSEIAQVAKKERAKTDCVEKDDSYWHGQVEVGAELGFTVTCTSSKPGTIQSNGGGSYEYQCVSEISGGDGRSKAVDYPTTLYWSLPRRAEEEPILFQVSVNGSYDYPRFSNWSLSLKPEQGAVVLIYGAIKSATAAVAGYEHPFEVNNSIEQLNGNNSEQDTPAGNESVAEQTPDTRSEGDQNDPAGEIAAQSASTDGATQTGGAAGVPQSADEVDADQPNVSALIAK